MHVQRDTRLSVRAEAARLPPTQAQTDASWTRLLSAEAHASAWRLVEASSRDSVPFDLELAWSAGDGSGATARISVASASRVCLFARHLQIRGRAVSPAEARVALHVADIDGFAPTANVWSIVAPAGEVVLVPPFARAVRADVAEGALADDAFLVLDGPVGTLAEVRLDRQPSAGVPVAGVTGVSVRTARPAVVRLCFHLHL